MDQTRKSKNIFESKAERRRNAGRSILVRLKDVENDLPQLKVRSWKQDAEKRDEGARFLKEAKVLRGPGEKVEVVVYFTDHEKYSLLLYSLRSR
jgi:hypothetical protein